MAMSESQWNSFNNMLPVEDRMSYADYLAASSAGTTSEPVVSTQNPYGEDWLGFIDLSSFNIVPPSTSSTSTATTSTATTSKATTSTTTSTTKTTTTSSFTPYTSYFNSNPSWDPFSNPVTPTPPTPPPVTPDPPPPPVKTAPIDTILFNDESLPIEIMADLIFEDIGGQEIINIARTDTVNGQSIIYQPIRNLTQIQQQYNPNNIVSLQAASDKYFQNFPIKLETKVPNVGNGPNGLFVYIDSKTGDLVVEVINIDADEQVELEITTSGTIYEAEL
jgi:hypothetical protein